MKTELKLSLIEHEKLLFLKSTVEVNKVEYTRHIEIALLGLLVSCHFKNMTQEAFDQLQDYYSPFKPSFDLRYNHHIHVFYECFADHRSRLHHPWYSEKYPQIHFLNHGDDTLIIERDYIARTPDQLQTLYAYGPIPDLDNPDSLDNLTAMLFSSCHSYHQAILVHSASVIKNGRAWVFFGQSGAGKSTLAFHAYQNFQNQVISSDQTILRMDGNKMWAQSTPITIPELPRKSPMRFWEPVEVAGIIHLKQDQKVGYSPLDKTELLRLFLEQSLFYLTPFSDEPWHLEACVQFLSQKNITYGQMSYKRDTDFWMHLPAY